MHKIKERALTYSLLAHIRGKGQLVSGPIEVFTPLIKRTLSKLNENGIFSGKSIVEIKNEAENLYSIDFPIPVLRTILSSIAKEINSETEKHFIFFQDDSFQIKNYAFTEFEETIRIHNIEIESLETIFKEFCETCGEQKPNSSSILGFIEKNKLSLSKYLAHKPIENKKDYTIEAQFVEFFRQLPPVYETIRKIYLGSILVSYIEYKTDSIKTDVELLLDTNFILGLLDLNTPESTHTCRKLIEITKAQGYKFSILKDTINETVFLLKAKAQNFDMSFLQKKIYPEDIYNACDRRGLNMADIERIADNLEMELATYGIAIVYETLKYRNLAKHSKEFEFLKTVRHSEAAAFHDATAIHYVRNKRNKRIKDFENVNCWFLNNSFNRDKYNDLEKNGMVSEYQPDIIKADDFLNIIWLSNPQIERNLDINEITEIGLSSLISIGLSASLPKLAIIKELDDNIHKYAQESGLNDADIVRIATRITTKQLTDIGNLNKLAKENKVLFVQRLNEEAKKQKELDDERIKRLDKILQEFIDKSSALNKLKSDFEVKAKGFDKKIITITDDSLTKDRRIDELQNQLSSEQSQRKKDENLRRSKDRALFISKQVNNWQRKTNYELIIWIIIFICSIFFILWLGNWNLKNALKLYTDLQSNIIFSSVLVLIGLIFSSITLKKWYDKNYNFSNIENYKKGLEIPENLNDIE